MLTIFSAPKPLRGQAAIIQANAIRSWLCLKPACEIILIGDEEGIGDFAAAVNVRHLPDVRRSESGTPLVSSIFDLAVNAATKDLMCYLNADILLLSDFLPAVSRIKRDRFLLVGQRRDIKISQEIHFQDRSWEAGLREKLGKEGRLHPPSGMDYFVFPRGLYRGIPDFAVGRPGWDNWMVYHARSRKIPVIDGTQAICAVHQDHDYAHHPGGQQGAFTGPEAQRNIHLLGSPGRSLNVRHAGWVLTPAGTRRSFSPEHLYCEFDALPALHPGLAFLALPKKIFIGLGHRLRSMFRLG